MKPAILLTLLLLSLAVGSCAALRQLIGGDPLPASVAVCPQLTRFPLPKMFDMSVVRVERDAAGQKFAVIRVEDWHNIGYNYAVLIQTVEKFQKQVEVYTATYYPASLTSAATH